MHGLKKHLYHCRGSKLSHAIRQHGLGGAMLKVRAANLTFFVQAMAPDSKVSGSPIRTTLGNSDGSLVVYQHLDAWKLDPEVGYQKAKALYDLPSKGCGIELSFSSGEC